METKEILNNAPEGATHFTQGRGTVSYFKWKELDQYFKYNSNKEWTDMFRPVSFIRSLKDLEEIEELKAKD